MSTGGYFPAIHRLPRILYFPTNHQSPPQYGHYLPNCWRVCLQNYQHWHQSTTSLQRRSSDKADSVRRRCNGLQSKSNRKKREKTRSPRQPLQPLSVDKRPQTWRIFWTLTLMVLRLLRCKSNLDLGLRAWRDLRVPHSELDRRPPTRLPHSNQTWTI